MSKKKRRKNKKFRAERQLQGLTLEMLEGWTSQEWGRDSARNFADFCHWLIKQIKALAKKPK